MRSARHALPLVLVLACSRAPSVPPHAVASSGAVVPQSPLPPATASASATHATPAAALPPRSPLIQLRADAASTTEWSLDAKGFPAVSSDGRLVALAFDELNTTGPPALVLTVEVRSIDSAAIVRTARFREAYQGELGGAYLTTLRKRVEAWVAQENLALAGNTWAPLASLQRSERSVCDYDPLHAQKLLAPPFEVSFQNGRLIVRGGAGKVLHDRRYADWTPSDSNRFGPCTYRPGLSEVFADQPRRVLVIKADHCIPGDNCNQGVPPSFAIVRLP